MTREGLLYVDHVRYVWSWTIRELSVDSVWRAGLVFPLQGVHRFKSSRRR
jgi:hypothetical protein